LISLHTKIAIGISFAGVALVSLWFARRQNRKPKLGGAISRPKQLWLAYAIFAWFFLSPILAFEPSFTPAFRTVVASFSILMWVRGAAELVMMYGTKNWKPPYGMTHDAVCIALLIGLPFLYPLDPLGASYVAALVVSLCFELYYAFAFFRAVEGKTTGEEGVWFASDDDPRFRRINRVTAIGNAILCTYLALFLLAAFLK
jgi:hypothetical protein